MGHIVTDIKGIFKTWNMSKFIIQSRLIQRVSSGQLCRTLLAENLPCVSCISTDQKRFYQKPPPKKGLVSKFIENVQEGLTRNKDFQDNIKKFKEEKAKLDESDSL